MTLYCNGCFKKQIFNAAKKPSMHKTLNVTQIDTVNRIYNYKVGWNGVFCKNRLLRQKKLECISERLLMRSILLLKFNNILLIWQNNDIIITIVIIIVYLSLKIKLLFHSTEGKKKITRHDGSQCCVVVL